MWWMNTCQNACHWRGCMEHAENVHCVKCGALLMFGGTCEASNTLETSVWLGVDMIGN